MTNLLQCHNNASVITGRDSGEAIEEYAVSYMTKEGAPLLHAAAVLLAAIDNLSKHPSLAEDTGTLKRTGKHLAAWTVNSFSGSHQWSLPVMAYALRGHKSFSSTESFWFLFPHDNVAFRDGSNKHKINTSYAMQILNKEMLEDTLQALQANINEHNDQDSAIGARANKVGNSTVFLTQAESYAHQGEHFHDYSQLEFECTTDLIERKPKKPTQVQADQHKMDLT